MSVFQSVNPVSGELLQHWPAWEDADVRALLDDQARQWPSLASVALEQRLDWLVALGRGLDAARDELAGLISREMGKPQVQAEAEVDKTRALLDYLVAQAPAILAPAEPAAGVRRLAAPLGGVLGIMPWNYPLWQAARFALPALVAGNSVTLKPAPNVLLTNLLLERLVREAGFPNQALRVLPATVEQLSRVYDHDHIQQVHFTGSSQAGREIAAACGRHLKPTTLELGGNDAWLLTDTGDLDAFVDTALASRMNNSGQSCLCAKRWLVPADRLDAVLARLEDSLGRYRPAPPHRRDTTLGPLARADIVERLLGQWRSLKAGASRHSPDPSVDGNFVGPAWAVTADPAASPVWPQEVFGPVVQLAAYNGLDQAIDWANLSRYGLGGSVWDADPERASAIALRLNTRNVGINRPMRSRIDVAFGGRGDSGWGQELGREGLEGLVRQQVQLGNF